jgi:tRNA pseudouridine32 synthase/23S rRNA pseudouridine746 synthase
VFALQTSCEASRDGKLEIVYCDDQLLVANKPSGMLSVPGRGPEKADSLTTRVQMEFPDALSVHRLDMATSGLLVFARGAIIHQQLSRLFCERGISKRYIAIVAGRIEPVAGEIDLPLAADWPNRPKQKVDLVSGKPSLTRYRLLGAAEGYFQSQPGKTMPEASRIELEAVTGRTHQLRVHLSAIGHPVLGDELYGERNCCTANRLLLHARGLSFMHPSRREMLSLTAEPPF